MKEGTQKQVKPAKKAGHYSVSSSKKRKGNNQEQQQEQRELCIRIAFAGMIG